MQVEIREQGIKQIVSGIDSTVLRLGTLESLMPEIETMVRAAAQLWFDSDGEGTWQELAFETLVRKAQRGAPYPDRTLYEWGDLYDSVVSPTGPYSYSALLPNGIEIGVDDPVAAIHAEGRPPLPKRPIWPSPTSPTGLILREDIAELILEHITPVMHGVAGGAVMTPWGFRGAHGRFVSKKSLG